VLQWTCAPASAGTVRQPTKACRLPDSQPAQRTVHDTASLPTAGSAPALTILAGQMTGGTDSNGPIRPDAAVEPRLSWPSLLPTTGVDMVQWELRLATYRTRQRWPSLLASPDWSGPRFCPPCGPDLGSPAPKYRQPCLPPSEPTGRNGRKNIGSETVGLVTALPPRGRFAMFCWPSDWSVADASIRSWREPAQATFPELPDHMPQLASGCWQLISACIKATRGHSTLSLFEKAASQG
jgi:hypothetical protein